MKSCANQTVHTSARLFLSICLTAVGISFCFSDSALAGTIADRFRDRGSEAISGIEGLQSSGEPSDTFQDQGGRGQPMSCADWSRKVKRLERFSRGRNQGPNPDLVDLAYGRASLEKMDVFLSRSGSAPAPIIVMVHGGGWCVGDKGAASVTKNKVQRWTSRGFVFVSLNYPMVSDGSDALAQAGHVAKAVAFIQRNAAQWGADGRRLVLIGHSAGAHLVSLVNADDTIRRTYGVQPLLGVISLDAGAIDVVKQMPKVYPFLKERYLEAFGQTEAEWKDASPYHRLGGTASPWLGVCSTTRKDDPCGQARAYVQKSLGFGVRADLLAVPMSHGAINNELGLSGDYTRNVEQFMASLDASLAQRLGME